MSNLIDRLIKDFHDPEYRHVYADESLNAYIATQIKVLREQRDWTQAELAERCDMQQSRISALEDIDYSSWSINTLRRLSQAFDLRLSVKFESFGSLLPEVDNFKREALERPSFDDDYVFSGSQPASTNIATFACSTVPANGTGIVSWNFFDQGFNTVIGGMWSKPVRQDTNQVSGVREFAIA